MSVDDTKKDPLRETLNRLHEQGDGPEVAVPTRRVVPPQYKADVPPLTPSDALADIVAQRRSANAIQSIEHDRVALAAYGVSETIERLDKQIALLQSQRTDAVKVLKAYNSLLQTLSD